MRNDVPKEIIQTGNNMQRRNSGCEAIQTAESMRNVIQMKK